MFKIRDDVSILDLLARCGHTTYRLRRDHIFGESQIQRLREGKLPNWETLDYICKVTALDPWEIIEYTRDQ